MCIDDIVNKYNNHISTIKIKPVDVPAHILTLVKKMMIKTLNLKLVTK